VVVAGRLVWPADSALARAAGSVFHYQPADRFWPFQGIESATFLALALALLVAAIWWVRARIA
jgi:hypothetical protein